jgi:rubrerythrin
MNRYIERLHAAYKGEMEAYSFYSHLASGAPSSSISQILTSIARDEYGHARTIWGIVSGTPSMGSAFENITIITPKGTMSFEEGVREAIGDELGDMSEYADLARIAPKTEERLILLSIAGDEYGHARTFSAILSMLRHK